MAFFLCYEQTVHVSNIMLFCCGGSQIRSITLVLVSVIVNFSALQNLDPLWNLFRIVASLPFLCTCSTSAQPEIWKPEANTLHKVDLCRHVWNVTESLCSNCQSDALAAVGEIASLLVIVMGTLVIALTGAMQRKQRCVSLSSWLKHWWLLVFCYKKSTRLKPKIWWKPIKELFSAAQMCSFQLVFLWILIFIRSN